MLSVDSWAGPAVPELDGNAVEVQVFDAVSAAVRPVRVEAGRATIYVCGITPYDATHLGHAATYLAFDTLNRALRQAGVEVEFAENITDVDDPLFERAGRDGVDWRELAESQTDLFRGDMEALRVIPPHAFVRVQDALPEIATAVAQLVADGFAYEVPTESSAGNDLYLDLEAVQQRTSFELGSLSHFSPERLAEAFVEFGGDPQREGKRCPLDPLLWRAAREGEPSWPGGEGVPAGRPGWHVECSVISTGNLTTPDAGPLVSLQGGGQDLVFPHHEMSAAHTSALTGREFAGHFTHAGLISYRGEKMSKSLGNLVLVSRLTAAGHEAAAIRLTILSHHYRESWEWFDSELSANEARLVSWREAAARAQLQPESNTEGGESATRQRIRAAIANDLDTPAAIVVVDEWAASEHPASDVPETVDALLGIDLLGR